MLPQARKVKYLRVFMSDKSTEQEMDKRFGAASMVMQTLYWTIAVKKELSLKAKLLIYLSVYVLTLTSGQELWVLNERTRSRIQVAEMRFL